MSKQTDDRNTYRKPRIETVEAHKVVEALGPVSAGSGDNCAPMLENFCW